MSLSIPYFSVTAIMVLLANHIPDMEPVYDENECRIRNEAPYRQIIACITLILIVFCAFKEVRAISIDEYAYRNRFLYYSAFPLPYILKNSGGEYINSLLVWLSTVLFQSSQGIFIVFGTLTAVFYMLAIKKYSGNYAFAVALLMCMGIINTSFNITQQCLACAIFVCCCDSISERRLLPFLLVVLCCYFIHNSAIILPLFFLCGSDRDTEPQIKPYLMLVSFVILYIYSNLSFLANRIQMFEQYVSRAEGFAGKTTNILTVLINCIPAFLVFLSMNNDVLKDRITAAAGNMCLIHAAIYMTAIFDNYIARIALYTAPFCVIFLSRILGAFEENSRKLFVIGMVALYSIELYFRMRGYTYTFNFSF